MMNRRNFLRHACASMGVAGGLATNLASFNAFAADVSDYKALVCVFLFGGMDGHDTVIPFDQSSYNDWEDIRNGLLSGYNVSRRRNNLLQLGGAGGNLGGRTFALPQDMQPLHELWEQGDMAVVGNVGPLIEPVTRQTFLSGAARVPPRLGSHNDSQSIWMASQPEGARAGWGGRFADIVQASSANSNASFTSVSASGSTVFLGGENVQPFEVSSSGAIEIEHLDSGNLLGSSVFAENYEAILRNSSGDPSNLFGKDMVRIMRSAIDNNSLLMQQIGGNSSLSTQFPNSGLGAQLNVVSRMISRRQALGVRRQVYFVSLGGFDTHRTQVGELPGLQQDLALSMRAFHDAMGELGIADNVTAFTASDFGRTLGINRNGTDHGWGGHHMVVGGAVNGGQILGDVPPAAFNHQFDSGRGRLIPQISVDQYAGALGRWFGLSNSEIIDALPGFGNFDANALNGLFA